MAVVYWIRHTDHFDLFTQGYIGVTNRKLSARMTAHRAASKSDSKMHLPICRAFRKYGKQLIVSVLVIGSEDYVRELEQKLRPSIGIGWNVAIGGQATGLGREHSEESRLLRRESQLGRKHSLESRRRMSEASKGIPKSEPHKEACRRAALGHIRSQELKDRQRLLMLGNKNITDAGRKSLSTFQKGIREWQRSRSNLDVWSKALEAETFQKSAAKFSQRYLAKLFGMKDSQVAALYEKLKSGWNPAEDLEYIQWLSQYKEVNDSTQPLPAGV